MVGTTMTIDGMSCGHCVQQVRKALEALDGVNVQQVMVGSATLTHDPAAMSEARIREAVEAAGYQVSSMTR
jgi:copper chaperone CopZ